MKDTAALTDNIDLTTQGNSADQLLYYDLAYELNFNMWDRFFMSSNTDKSQAKNDKQEWQTTLPDRGTWVSPYLQVTQARAR